MKIIEFDQIDSTGEYCKRNYAGRPFTVTAQVQTSGCATERKNPAERGGLYLSFVRHPHKQEATDAFIITANACTAVCRTLESYGLNPVIRWRSDILVNGKKICGVLVENTFSGSFVSRSIISIELNINNKLPEDFLSVATTLKAQTGTDIAVDEFRNKLLENIDKRLPLRIIKVISTGSARLLRLRRLRVNTLQPQSMWMPTANLFAYLRAVLKK